MGDNLLVWAIVLLSILWLVQLIWLYWDSQNRRIDPIRTVSGAAGFWALAAPIAVMAPRLVDSVGGFWEKVSAPLENMFGGRGGEPTSHRDPSPARVVVDGVAKPLVNQRVRLGRYPNNEIVFDHSTVSAYHAEIIARADGKHEIFDRESRNGTRVNGDLIRSQVLQDGDLITLGAASMHYVGGDPVHVQAEPEYDDYEAEERQPRYEQAERPPRYAEDERPARRPAAAAERRSRPNQEERRQRQRPPYDDDYDQ